MKDNLPERERGVKDHDPAGGSKNNNPEAKTKPLPDLMTNKGGGDGGRGTMLNRVGLTYYVVCPPLRSRNPAALLL